MSGVLGREWLVASPETVRGMWSHRMLRQFDESARDQRYHATGHPVAASFEPGEEWFWSYKTQSMFAGALLAPPRSHPEAQPVPEPKGMVPSDWRSRLY